MVIMIICDGRHFCCKCIIKLQKLFKKYFSRKFPTKEEIFAFGNDQLNDDYRDFLNCLGNFDQGDGYNEIYYDFIYELKKAWLNYYG